MKYKFNFIDDDTSELVYKDKKFEIKKDVELQKEVQNINNKARILMRVELAKQGLTGKDLIIVRKEGNKTYEDKSNLIELEQDYMQQASLDLFQTLSKKYFNMTLEELGEDIGLTPEEYTDFGKDFAYALAGKKSPSQKQ